MESIKIKINEVEYTVKQSIRSLMYFEEMTGKSINTMDNSFSDIMKLFFCILKAANKNFTYTFDQFVDELDNSPESLEAFNEYIISLMPKEENKKKVKKD